MCAFGAKTVHESLAVAHSRQVPHINDPGVDLCADVLIVHEGRVLLRVHDKHGIWLTVGGHVDPDEDLNRAAVREAWEEVGLEVELVPPEGFVAHRSELLQGGVELIPPRFLNKHRITDTHEHVSGIYFARPVAGSSVEIKPQLEGDRSDQWHWWSREELTAADCPVSATIRRYALAALDVVG